MSQLYSVGDCPVCESSGMVLALRRAGSDQIVFFCPLCGTAWTQVPQAHELDEINALRELAPDGVELLSSDDADSLRALGLDPEATDYGPWAADLAPHLATGRTVCS